MNGLKEHYILCGIGRTGIHIAKEFLAAQVPFVVIDHKQNAFKKLQVQCNLDGRGLLQVEGDAAEDEILEMAGVKQAKGLVTSLRDDKDNIFVVLTARSLNPDLYIVARVENEEENADKLRKAGANQVIAPNIVGGQEMASEMIRPEVSAFLDQMLHTSHQERRLYFTELPVDEIELPLEHRDELCIMDIGQHVNLLVLAIKRDGEYHYKPKAKTRLRRSTNSTNGDILIVIGLQEQLEKARGRG